MAKLIVVAGGYILINETGLVYTYAGDWSKYVFEARIFTESEKEEVERIASKN